MTEKLGNRIYIFRLVAVKEKLSFKMRFQKEKKTIWKTYISTGNEPSDHFLLQ
jgi:hypothetical protein